MTRDRIKKPNVRRERSWLEPLRSTRETPTSFVPSPCASEAWGRVCANGEEGRELGTSSA